MFKRAALVLTVLMSHAAACAEAPEFVMIAPLNLSMPFVQFHKDKLAGGILKDMGEAIAHRLGRTPRFVSVPGEAVSAFLAAGKADGICFVRPHWIDGEFDWSAAFMTEGEMIASRPDAPRIGALSDLRDRPVGTVASHRYPRIENVLGLRFQRVDSANVDDNLRKLLDGTVQHALMGLSTLQYQARSNHAIKLRPDMAVSSFGAQCAFTRKGRVPFGEVDKAINALLKDGSVEKILERYR
jgi:polar amino acid transport system substrate-binding protein